MSINQTKHSEAEVEIPQDVKVIFKNPMLQVEGPLGKTYKNFKKLVYKKELIVGEQTATYLFHPLVAKRVYNTIPTAKLIMILRNPVDRAYSDYQHQVREGVETRTFEDAIKSELKRIEIGKKEPRFIMNIDDFIIHPVFSYLRYGIYVDFIKKWMVGFYMDTFFEHDHNDHEFLILIKTSVKNISNCKDVIKKLHNYDVPETIQLNAEILNDDVIIIIRYLYIYFTTISFTQ